MSDYSQVTNFTAKDALSSGDPEKIILGSDIDAELSAISTAIATKYDSTNRASTAEAQALTSNTVLLTPSTLNDVLTENGGMLGDIQALADPNADQLLGWDDSAGAVVGFTLGTGLGFTATPTIEISFLGLEDLVDPNADRIMFWDDSESKLDWLTVGNGIDITTTSIDLTDVSAGANNCVNVSSGTFTTDITALGAAVMTDLDATDTFMVDDGGTAKKIQLQELGMRVQTAQTTQTLAAADMNSIMKFTGTATLTIQLNATTDLPIGVPVVLIMDHASQQLTVTADTSVTLESVNHPGGGSAASDTVLAGGMAVLVQTETDVWQLSGDITD